jgi:polysaccharide export outer membrane protein
MRVGLFSLLLLGLGACSILPNDGPSSHSISKAATRPAAPYALVDLSFPITQLVAAQPDVVLAGLAAEESEAPNDRIAGGDVLSIGVFEAGAGGLFARPPDNGVNSQVSLPKVVVDPGGFLTIPFAGEVHVAGLTPVEAEAAIRRSLRGRAINPQITLTVLDSRANSVVVLGEVRNSGHFPLTPHNDHLFDAIASAGGPTKSPADLVVTVQRGLQSADVPMSTLLARPADNIRLAPQDQVRVLYKPRRYDVFGALGRISQTVIEDDSQTLASALSRAGGLDTLTANAKAVYVFRFERPAIARAIGVTVPAAAKGVPIVYRLDLLKPEGFFIANNFDIKPDDLLYVARSDLTQTEKFLNVVNLSTQIGYNARIVGVVP